MCLLLCFLFNVVACKCDPGGSVNMNCFKHSGDCSCVTGVRGKKCDRYRWDLFRSCLSILYPSIYNFLRWGGGGVGGWRRIMGCSSLDYSLLTIIKNRKKTFIFHHSNSNIFVILLGLLIFSPRFIFSAVFNKKSHRPIQGRYNFTAQCNVCVHLSTRPFSLVFTSRRRAQLESTCGRKLHPVFPFIISVE